MSDTPEAPDAEPRLASGTAEVTGETPGASTQSHVVRIAAVWLLALAAGVLIPLLAPNEARFEWLALAVGVCTLVTFALQLGTAQREGFITRTATSVAGSVVIIAAADAVSALVG